MNKHRFLIVAMGVTLFAASCKKNDLVKEEATTVQTEWKTASSWKSSKEEGYVAHNSTIEDKNITADVVENGLVLVYLKNGNNINSLPYQQKGAANAYWYYQVSENTIELNADMTEGAQPDSRQAFSYFIVSADKVKLLEKKGLSIAEMMSLSYEQAKNILK
jgi:hypothetical protein